MSVSFPYAFAMRGCTQEDAPALELYLVSTPPAGETPAPPFIRIEVSSRPSETFAAETFALVPLRRDPAHSGRIVRGELRTDERTQQWLSGTLTFIPAASGQVAGFYDFSLPPNRRFAGEFKAPIVRTDAVCG